MTTSSLICLITVMAFLAAASCAQAETTRDETAGNDAATWIDVRTAEEFGQGHVEGAINIPYEQSDAGVAELGLKKDAVIYLYCRSGKRAGIALDSLEASGYSGVVNVGGLEQALVVAENSVNRL